MESSDFESSALFFSELVDRAEGSKPPNEWIETLNTITDDRGVAERLNKSELKNMFLRGLYPEIASNKDVDRQLWCGSYITTYIERNIRNLTNVGDLSQFERFLVPCALRTGQILNISEIARDIETLVKGPVFDNLFETLVICDFLKRFYHHGMKPSMYYLRTRDGLEIDMVIEMGGKLHLFEIKSVMTIVPKHALHIQQIINSLGHSVKTSGIISYSDDNFPVVDNIYNYSWKRVLML